MHGEHRAPCLSGGGAARLSKSLYAFTSQVDDRRPSFLPSVEQEQDTARTGDRPALKKDPPGPAPHPAASRTRGYSLSPSPRAARSALGSYPAVVGWVPASRVPADPATVLNRRTTTSLLLLLHLLPFVELDRPTFSCILFPFLTR